MKSLNAANITVKMQRIDLCDLLLACTMIDCSTDKDNKKWARLHDMLKEQLDEIDEKLEKSGLYY